MIDDRLVQAAREAVQPYVDGTAGDGPPMSIDVHSLSEAGVPTGHDHGLLMAFAELGIEIKIELDLDGRMFTSVSALNDGLLASLVLPVFEAYGRLLSVWWNRQNGPALEG